MKEFDLAGLSRKRLLPERPVASLVLLSGDLLALYLFVLVGQWDHQMIDAARPLTPALLSSLPFALVWLAVAWWLRAFFIPEAAGWRPLLGRALHAWLLAGPLALFGRALLLGRGSIATVFIAVTLVFGGLFLLGWRLLFGLVYHRFNR